MSLKFDSKDPQVLFNLAGAYTYKDKYKEALHTINKCLELSPKFPSAENLKQQLENIVNKKD